MRDSTYEALFKVEDESLILEIMKETIPFNKSYAEQPDCITGVLYNILVVMKGENMIAIIGGKTTTNEFISRLLERGYKINLLAWGLGSISK